jgi:PAS domain S-box-containing protein
MRKRDEPPKSLGIQDERHETRLAELETYRQVFWSSPDFISISRLADGVYVDVNPGFEQFTGYKRPEVVGRSSLEIGVWPDPSERGKFVAELQRSGQVQHFATRLRNRQGDIRNVEMTGSLVELNEEQLLVIRLRLPSWCSMIACWPRDIFTASRWMRMNSVNCWPSRYASGPRLNCLERPSAIGQPPSNLMFYARNCT